jgi:hypothetical protein
MLAAKLRARPVQCERLTRECKPNCATVGRMDPCYHRPSNMNLPNAPWMRLLGTQVLAQQSPPSNWHCGMLRSASQKPLPTRVVPPAEMTSGHGPPVWHCQRLRQAHGRARLTRVPHTTDWQVCQIVRWLQDRTLCDIAVHHAASGSTPRPRPWFREDAPH